METLKVTGEESLSTFTEILRAKNNCHPQNDVTANEPLTLTLSRQGRGNNINASLVKADCELRAKDAHGGEEPAEQSIDPLNASNQAGGGPLAVVRFKPCHSEPYYYQATVETLKVTGEESLSTFTEILRVKNDCHPQNDVTANEPLTLALARQGRGNTNASLSKGGGAKRRWDLINHKIAFTLAEVLITLGIIGVVAAMTLPSVVNNYKQHELITRVRKVYFTLNQALRLSVAENGEFSEWSYDIENNSEGFVAKYRTPYFLAVGGVRSPGYSETRPFISPNGEVYGFGQSDGSGVTRTHFKFNDGSLVWIITGGASCQDGECIGCNFSAPTVNFDVNGIKPPNKVGLDFFIMEISTRGNMFVPSCHSDSDAVVNQNCSRNGSGKCCLEKLMRDNWEMKADYPYKI